MIDVIRLMLVLVGGAIVLGVVWRYDLTKLLTALGVGSIVIGLALQEPLGNVISGLMLMLERPIKIGDWINTEGVVGKITEINWRSVHVETPLRELRIIPNSCLYKGTFSNLARPTPVRTEMLDLGFSYDDPPNKVKDVLMGLLRTTPGILADPAPVIRTVNYADFSIIYKVIFSVGRQEDLYEARDAFMTRVWYAARRHGLTIPFPIQTEIQVGPDDLKQRRGPTRAQVLQNLPRFAIRDDSLVRDLVERVEVRTFARGERIAEEGKPLEGLHLVLSGRAILSVRDREGTEHEIAHVGRGEFFGEGSLLTGQSSDLTITVLEDLEVLVFDSSAVHRWLDRTPRLARELGSLLDVRRRAAGVARKLAGARG
jgi:CRP-like cAMP-binding protein